MARVLILIASTLLYSSVNSMPAVHTGLLPDSHIVVAPFNNLADVTNKKIAQVIKTKTVTLTPPFPDSGRKHAVLEYEDPFSKKDSAYGQLQQFVASFYNPKPIVDTIQEHEKYGNDGEKFRKVGVAIVGGVEGISNLINAAIEIPTETVKQISRKISDSLNSVGAKLVGL
ncbi:uncharacterized protein LOC103314730 [Tribolium castaneum]|uniref:Uncharacterized protein n=1 Tax=Tribolium castaneum TaxID=7070 RepID=A0A139WBG3_TRICA|nr:PREDICTED: uncharacterized protein LOC103314730 [Tribolium castaneum]KYB25233.1 hypothetical protein TcasGA2_TC034364 [Tribolium castaneum]|eukprot:XP_008199675.1 PREDICTED: uncharacterized protein LOC103314730 [Tribolium castaneum]